MKKALKIGAPVLVGLLLVTLFTLRLTGLEPGFIDPSSEEFARSNRIARPGLWLKGEVVRTPVTDWESIVDRVHEKTGRDRRIQLETRTRYFIPHSVTIGVVGIGDKLYIHAHSDENRIHIPFPYDKTWTANVARDPRVRMKLDGKIYEMTLALMTDRAAVAEVMGRDPVTTEKGPDGKEHVKEVMHYWRVFQRNVPDFSSGLQGVGPEHP